MGLYWICLVLLWFCHSVTFQMKIFVTLFSGTVRPRRLKLGTHMDSGQMYRVYQNQAAPAYLSLYFFIFFLSNFQILKFSSHFSQELWHPEDWNLVHTWTMGRWIMYIGVRLLLHIRPFISSFFFLSNFQTLKFFVTLFSGTVRPRRLKLYTLVDSWKMYGVYRNQAAAAYSSIYFSFFFLSNFQTWKFFVTLFSGTVRPRRLKLVTHMENGWMYCVYQNHAAALIHPFNFSFFFLSNFQT